MTEWKDIGGAPAKKVVMTKIDDAVHGERNVCTLFKSGTLWFVPDGSLYAYYRPSHWRELTMAEHNEEVERAKTKLAAAQKTYERTLAGVLR